MNCSWLRIRSAASTSFVPCRWRVMEAANAFGVSYRPSALVTRKTAKIFFWGLASYHTRNKYSISRPFGRRRLKNKNDHPKQTKLPKQS